ncbi:hypothetical protein [Nodularia sp. NIES-3585]|nr:hypothetical protein [Nodularia sp. NIES-3585]
MTHPLKQVLKNLRLFSQGETLRSIGAECQKYNYAMQAIARKAKFHF